MVSAEGGPGTVQPQAKQTVTLNLRPGQYVLVCFIEGADGVPHLAKGMVKPFTVNPGGSAQNSTVEPRADQTVTMKDFAFEIPAQVKAGPQTWKVVNAGPQIHEMGIVKLNPGTTFQDLQAMISSNQTMSGPPPFTEAGGFQAISPGLTGWVSFNLEPGEWTLDDMIADTEKGILMQDTKSWSIDDLRLNFQFSCEVGWLIENGRITNMVRNPSYQGITPQFWNSCDAVANRHEWRMWGVLNCGKGDPMQVMHVGHGTSRARFQNVRIGIK
jgi:hypothetical protein